MKKENPSTVHRHHKFTQSATGCVCVPILCHVQLCRVLWCIYYTLKRTARAKVTIAAIEKTESIQFENIFMTQTDPFRLTFILLPTSLSPT